MLRLLHYYFLYSLLIPTYYCLTPEERAIADRNFAEFNRKTTLFTGPLMQLEGGMEELEDWVEDAKEQGMKIYVEELASLVTDAIAAIETLIPYPGVLDEHRKLLPAFGLPIPIEERRLRYTGLEEDFEKNRDHFGTLFTEHIQRLLPKIRWLNHRRVMEEDLPDAIRIRNFVDKHWTRYGSKKTTVETPDATKAKFVKLKVGEQKKVLEKAHDEL